MIVAVKALLCAGGLCVTSQFRDGFRVAWQNDDNASSAVVELCTAKPVPASSTELAHWSFASVTNSSGRIDDGIAASFSSLWPGLECDIVSIVEKTNGLVQVGTTSKRGFLRIVGIPDGVDDVVVNARIRNVTNGPKRLNVCALDSAGATNSLSQVYLTDQLAEYAAPATNAAQIVLYTNAIDYPPQFADIRLISGFRPAFVATNTISRVNVGLRSSWLFHHLEPGDYIWRVESRFPYGTPATFSPFMDVSLSPDDPPIPRGFTIRIR